MDAALESKLQQWLQWDKNTATLDEMKALQAKGDVATLQSVLSKRLVFGTAGLRARMGAGFARMNHLTVLQTAQGLAKYLLDEDKTTATSKGVVVGYDARHNSKSFAQITANVLRASGIKVYLFRQIVPTPFVPFGLLRYGCAAGVMVTASHNPKEDNGYKVYGSNGAQIVSPTDDKIAAAIEASLEPQPSSWVDTSDVTDPYDDVFESYYSSLAPTLKKQEPGAVKFTFTAMHGVGTEFTLKALEVAGVADDVVCVKEQCTPDPEFPTVKFPNPEEGKSSLDLAISTSEANNCRIILANDPDADRLAVAEKLPDNSGWRIFNGNEIGALLAWWSLQKYGQQPDSSVYLLSSAVSSKIIKSMSKKLGFSFEETLTGFKWMGSRSSTLMADGKKVLFAFEEAIGFMCGDRVLDKDGVTAAAYLAEMAVTLHRKEGKTLAQQLVAIFEEFGFHASYNSYMISKDPVKTKDMFDTMRSLCDGGYPKTLAGVKVVNVRDLSVGYDSAQPDGKALLPSSAVSPMITFDCENGVTLTIRGSGTEPKVKWYSEKISPKAEDRDVLVSFVDAAVAELMRPDAFGFVSRST